MASSSRGALTIEAQAVIGQRRRHARFRPGTQQLEGIIERPPGGWAPGRLGAW
ncbi:hypothetical protein [Streptomyces sp. NPDC058268]|uniref:hypothetical protein n=1 Tax=Streptomyces sp. NPDC058268 TaxID=3346413 RepID=UPI0036EE7B01